jgi:TonB family protein
VKLHWFELAVLTGAVSPADISQAPPSPQATSWQENVQQSHCAISTKNSNGVVFMLRVLPGDSQPDLFLIGAPKFLPPKVQEAVVQLAPTGQSWSANVQGSFTRPMRVLRVQSVGTDFIAAFARSTEIRVTVERKQIAASLRGSNAALTALRECIDRRLAEWGVDTKAHDTIKSPPTAIKNLRWLSERDYPKSLLKARWQGDMILRLNVDITGAVTDCSVVVSSGQKPADDATCLRAVQKARFNPAIGADGKPISAVGIQRIEFRMGD